MLALRRAFPRIATRAAVAHFTTKAKPTDNIQKFAEKIYSSLKHTKPELKDVIRKVWQDEEITAICPNLVIRLTTIRGEISRRAWQLFGNDPLDVQLLAIGSVDAPNHIPNYHKFLDVFAQKTMEYTMQYRKEKKPYSYDLLSKGDDTARALTLDYYNQYYGFPDHVLEKMKVNSAITAGGMRALKDTADSVIMEGYQQKSIPRFIQPDGSFNTWFTIIENQENDMNKYRRHVVTLATNPKDKLALTPEIVEEHYKKYPATPVECWYIIPVGNPTGTKMSSEQLHSTCETIVKHNRNALIILDSVYCRMLDKETCKELFSKVARDENVLNNILFIDSYSKSHGLCRERLGFYFSYSDAVFGKSLRGAMAFSGGPGLTKDFQFSAIATMTPEELQGIEDLHSFWQKERLGLYKYLMQPKFSHLFEEKQDHIEMSDLENKGGLYVLMKLKKGITTKDVFEETGALGVETPLASGTYVRYSLGVMKDPKYSKNQ